MTRARDTRPDPESERHHHAHAPPRTKSPAAVPQRPAPPTSPPPGRRRAVDLAVDGRALGERRAGRKGGISPHRHRRFAGYAPPTWPPPHPVTTVSRGGRGVRRPPTTGGTAPSSSEWSLVLGRSVVLRDDDPRARPSTASTGARAGPLLLMGSARGSCAGALGRGADGGPDARRLATGRPVVRRPAVARGLAGAGRGALRRRVPGAGRGRSPGAHAHWRTTRERLFQRAPRNRPCRPPSAPISAPAPRPRSWPALPRSRSVPAAARLPPGAMAPRPAGTAARTRCAHRLGRIELPLRRGTRAALECSGLPLTRRGLFIPFRDATNGAETYPAGRYLVDGARALTWAATPPRARSPSTSTTPTSRRAPSTRAGRARSHRPRTGSMSPIRAGERIA